MNMVEEYIEKQNRIILDDREKTLISLGLFYKEYSPDNTGSSIYSQCEYVNGDKRYYKESAIKVTDEEYELIISKAKQVEKIKGKEEQAELNKESCMSTRIAFVLRSVGWTIGLIYVVFSLFADIVSGSFFLTLIALGVSAINLIMFYALASILDYLAELTSVVRTGFKYK